MLDTNVNATPCSLTIRNDVLAFKCVYVQHGRVETDSQLKLEVRNIAEVKAQPTTGWM